MNESEPLNLVDSQLQEIVNYTIDSFSRFYQKNGAPIGEFPILGKVKTSEYLLEGQYPDEDIAHIVGALRAAIGILIPGRTVRIPPVSLERMVWQVYAARRLHPIVDVEIDGETGENITVTYEPFNEFEEIGTEDFDHTLSGLEKNLSDYEGGRFDALEKFFQARNLPEQPQSAAILLSCLQDIRKTREKITDLYTKNAMEDPFCYKKEEPSLSFSHHDHSPIATLWRIFHPSAAEKTLATFLPEGTEKEEPYLFHFLLAGSKIGEDLNFSEEKFAIYEKIYERKLLIYYHASTYRKLFSGEQGDAWSSLSFEIKAFGRSISQVLPDEDSEESEIENMISRVHILYGRAKALCERCLATEVGYDVAAVFDSILRHLSLFLVQPNSYAQSSEDDLAQNTIDIQRVLHDALLLSLGQLESCENVSPITDMRRILHEALECLVHD